MKPVSAQKRWPGTGRRPGEQSVRRGLPGGPRLAGVVLAAAGVAGLVGCDQVSEETRDAGATVLCSQIEVEPSEIEQNPESARLVALLVRDLAPDDNIRDIADRVADDPSALSPRAQLADWVNERCGSAAGGSGGSGSGGGADSGAGEDSEAGEDAEE